MRKKLPARPMGTFDNWLAEFERLNPQDELGRVAPPERHIPWATIVIIAALPALPMLIFFPWIGLLWLALLTLPLQAATA